MDVKNIPYCFLTMSDSTIWLNGISGCILRIAGLDLSHKKEKFSFMDVRCKNSIVTFYDETCRNNFENFISNLVHNLMYEFNDNPELCNDQVLLEIMDLVKSYKNEEQQ